MGISIDSIAYKQNMVRERRGANLFVTMDQFAQFSGNKISRTFILIVPSVFFSVWENVKGPDGTRK